MALETDDFSDIDVGILGKVDLQDIFEIGQDLKKSTFPYRVDLVDFNCVSESFKNCVLKTQSKYWIHKAHDTSKNHTSC